MANINEDPTELSLSNSSVEEDQVIGTIVGTFETTDEDAGDTFTYALVSGTGSTDNSRFQIDGNELKTNEVFNYEPPTTYSIRVKTTDSGNLSYEKVLTISITNLPPTAPVDENDTVANQVAENAENGTEVGITASSEDPAGADITYSLVNADGRFAIDDITGVVTVADKDMLDHEGSGGSYTITISASDGYMSQTADFVITVTDANDEPTNITLSNASVEENQPPGTVIGTLETDDQDIGDTFSYALVDGAGSTDNALFQIVNSDQLATNQLLNYEPPRTYSVRVKTTDSGDLSYEKVLTISIINLPPAAPTDSNAANNEVAENATNGTTVGITAQATDPAGGPVSYVLTDNAGGRFTIDPTSGVVAVADGSLVNFEEAASYTIAIKAHDPALAYSTESVFTIDVLDGNDPPSVPTGQVRSIAEASSNGALVGAPIDASDEDVPAQSLTFVITAGNTGDTFTIDDETGQITVSDNTLLDFESNPTFVLTIEVTDDGSPSASTSRTVTINVTNLPPTVPVDTDGASGGAVDEGAANGTAVGITAFATDPPAGGTITYDLADDAGGRFAIDLNSGIVTVANGSVIDYEGSSGSYTITVRASDGDLSQTASFAIAITNRPPAAPGDDDNAANAVDENASAGTVVGITALASDPGGG